MEEIIKGIYHLFTFKKYTLYDRWFEIGLGVLAWIGILIIILTILK